MLDPKWISFYLFCLSGVIQIGLFVSERFLLKNKSVIHFLGFSDGDVAGSKHFINIIAYNHLCFAILTFVGLHFVLKLQPAIAGPISSFAGFFILFCGFTYWRQSKQFLKVALLQIVPVVLGFFFLAFHIFPAFRG